MNEETITESAKAVQEVAKTTGQALDLTVGFTGWVGEVLGRPIAEAVGYYVTDRIQAKRIEASIYDKARFLELLREVHGVIDAAAINVRALPPKVAIPLLEAATMEFDDRLLRLWANLLATAINADEDPVERQYVSILSELSVADAQALAGLWRDSFKPFNQEVFKDGPVTYRPSLDTGSYGEHTAANLTRLGLVTASIVELSLYVPGDNDEGSWGPRQHDIGVPGEYRFVMFTDLGRAFCRAVGIEAPEKGEPAAATKD